MAHRINIVCTLGTTKHRFYAYDRAIVCVCAWLCVCALNANNNNHNMGASRRRPRMGDDNATANRIKYIFLFICERQTNADIHNKMDNFAYLCTNILLGHGCTYWGGAHIRVVIMNQVE